MDQSLIDILIHSNPKEISKLYYLHRSAFFYFGKKYGVDQDSMADIYQDAFVVLRKQAIQGKLEVVNSSLKTYLFGIGKRMIFNHYKQHKNTVSLEPKLHIANDNIEKITFDEPVELSVEQRLLQTFFNKLGKRCKEMLILFYYRGLTVEEIAEKEGYDNTNVVSSQKSRCIKQLRAMINPPKQ